MNPRRPLRWLLWSLLVVALVAVAAAAAVQWLRNPDAPPVMGQVPDFSLTNRDGSTVRLADLAGAPWIADFVFTRCNGSCPLMSLRMQRLNRELPPDLGVRLVSITVDPDYDTPQILQAYAESFSAPGRWLFLTGAKEEVYGLIRQGFKLALDPSPPPGAATAEEPIIHSTRFVLVDGRGQIRGYYGAFDEEAMARLAEDLRAIAD
ncbi:MAG TPA: SCO family protein [Thermoanaerobaculia bacterium]|nr:SCO family protein [Thermoanaerobaculia bacterium]